MSLFTGFSLPLPLLSGFLRFCHTAIESAKADKVGSAARLCSDVLLRFCSRHQSYPSPLGEFHDQSDQSIVSVLFLHGIL